MGLRLFVLLAAVAYGADRLGTIDLPCAQRRGLMGLRLFVLLAAVAYSADRLGTIDLPWRQRLCIHRFDQTVRVAHRVNLPRYPGKRKELHFGVGFAKWNLGRVEY